MAGGDSDAGTIPASIVRREKTNNNKVMQAAVQRAKIQPGDVNDVLIGNVLAELGFAKTGRTALNAAGFPNSTTFHTVNRQCSSSLQALTHIAHSIVVGQIDVGMAGGVESMTRNYGTRGIPVDVSPTLKESPVKDARDCLLPMGITSENVAERYGVSRQAQDEFALESQNRASRAQKAGIFDREIVKIQARWIDPETKEESVKTVELDEGVRHGVTLEKLAALKPAFKENGGSTAGNSFVLSSLATCYLQTDDDSGHKSPTVRPPSSSPDGRGLRLED